MRWKLLVGHSACKARQGRRCSPSHSDDAAGQELGGSLGCVGEGRNGRGLVVLDVEEAVHLGDLEQVADPLAEVH
jgi:hypothetical protein